MDDYSKIEYDIYNFIDREFLNYLHQENSIINNEVLLVLKNQEDNICMSTVNIINRFPDEYNFISNILKLPNLYQVNTNDILDFILKSNLLKIAKYIVLNIGKDQKFDYCVCIDGRYLPDINVDLEEELKLFNQLIDGNKNLFTSNYYSNQEKIYLLKTHYLTNTNIKKFNFINFEPISTKENMSYSIYTDLPKHISFNKYFKLRNKLIKEFCSYILYWIQAYNFDMQVKYIKKYNNIISYSHRCQGWAQPSFLFKDLKIQFKTNFGFGNSSYFSIMLEYKGIKLVPFMDWITYPYHEAKQVLQYTQKIHRSIGKQVSISNDDWIEAMNYVNNACTLYLTDEKKFIEKYVLNELNSMINELFNILKLEDKELYEEYGIKSHYKNINNDDIFNIIGKADDLRIKSSKICGALGFIGKIFELSNIIDLSNSIYKLEKCNSELLKLLEKSTIDIKYSLPNLYKNLENINQQISYIYDDTSNPKNIKNMEEQKSKLTDDDFLKIFPDFMEIKSNYKNLINRKEKITKNIKEVETLLKNIERYINIIRGYFQNKALAAPNTPA